MDYVIWHSFFIFCLEVFQLLQKAVSLLSGSFSTQNVATYVLFSVMNSKVTCFLFAIKPWSGDLYQILHSVCKVVACFTHVHEPVPTSLVNLFMVSRNAEEGLRRPEDLSESSFHPSLVFSLCLSVGPLSLSTHHGLLSIGWPGVMTQSVKSCLLFNEISVEIQN